MQRFRNIQFLLLIAVIGLVMPVQLSAQTSTAVEDVWTFNVNGNNQAWLDAVRPIMERFKKLSPDLQYNIYQSTISGPGYGRHIIVVRYPSMASMEQARLKGEGDSELEKLWPALGETGMTVESRVLLSDVTK